MLSSLTTRTIMNNTPRLLCTLVVAALGLWTTTAAAHLNHGDAGHGSTPKAPRAPMLSLDDMVRHDAAEWEMGISSDREVGDYGDSWLVDQQPRHTVETDAFYLDETEVTVRQFALFLTYAAGDLHYHPDQPIDPVDFGYLPEPDTADQPIRQVTWRAARDYCIWAGKRLPTEAEWEFAATGQQRRTYPWGDEGGGCEYANYFVGRSWCNDGPVAVDSYNQGDTPNGVADMGGNVAEWTADWYGEYPSESVTNPTGPDDGNFKVIRGGGFVDSGQFLRSQARRAAEPVRRAEDVGFRCALDGDVDPADVNDGLRGSLSLPPDSGRETEPRFPGEPVATPERVATGLNSPEDMVVSDGSLYVLENGDTIVEIDPNSGEITPVIDDTSGIFDLTTDGQRLYASVRNADSPDQGEILEIIPGMPATTIADGQTDPGPIAAAGDRIVWGTNSAVVSYDSSADSPAPTSVVSDLARVHAVDFVSDDQVAYASASTSNSTSGLKTSDFKLGLYDYSDQSDQELFPGDNDSNLFKLFYISSIDFDSNTSKLWTTFIQPGFPRHGYLCGVGLSETAQSECLATHTPPRPNNILAPGDDQVFWTSQRSVVTYTRAGTWMGPSTYDITATWSAPRGLLNYDGHLYWTDNRTGRLLRTSF